MDRRFRSLSPFVVSEIIAGEAIIMSLKSGRYFSTLGSGAAIWGWIAGGRSVGETAALFSLRYDLDPSSADIEVCRFVAELLAHELIVEETTTVGTAPTAAVALPATDCGHGDSVELEPYQPPLLSVHADMKDLLLLDPIHDVDPMGWPTPAKAA